MYVRTHGQVGECENGQEVLSYVAIDSDMFCTHVDTCIPCRLVAEYDCKLSIMQTP